MKKLRLFLIKLMNVYFKVFPVLFRILDFSLLQKEWNVFGISSTSISIMLFLITELINALGDGNTFEKGGCEMNEQRDFVHVEVVLVLLIISTCLLILT